MALVTCPHCGKSVTNTNEKCFYCGKSLTISKIDDYKDFSALSRSEKDKLLEEYFSANPNERKYMDVNAFNIIKFLPFFNFSLCLLVLFIMRSFNDNLVYAEYNSAFWGMGVVAYLSLAVSAIIVTIVYGIIRRKYDRKSVVVIKRFQRWLYTNRNLKWTIVFSNEEKRTKKYYDKVNVDEEI